MKIKERIKKVGVPIIVSGVMLTGRETTVEIIYKVNTPT